jgi:hypothetical protein
MKTLLSILIIFSVLSVSAAQAQENDAAKLPVYGNISIGYGNTFFYGSLAEKETINDGRGFGRNQGNTLATFFYVASPSWKGFGLGTGIKGFFATPNNGGNNETYLFNYYHVGLGAKYHFLTRTFNKGLYAKSSFGFGQMTEKMRYNDTKQYEHQFAIGTTVLAGIGYAVPVLRQKAALTVDLEFEYASRRGDVSGVGEDQRFQNSHVSINVGIGF